MPAKRRRAEAVGYRRPSIDAGGLTVSLIVPVHNGGAALRAVFLLLGGFDEAYRRPSIEAIDLGYRMTAAGQRIRLCKDLQVKHLKRWGAFSLFCSDFFDRALPWTALIVRSGRFEN